MNDWVLLLIPVGMALKVAADLYAYEQFKRRGRK